MTRFGRWVALVLVLMGVAGCGGGGGGGGAQQGKAAGDPAASPPVDLSALVRTVHFSYRASGAGYEGGHDTYGVELDASGALTFTPRLPGAAQVSAPVRFETTSIARGATSLGAEAGAAGLDRGGSLWLPRGEVVERFENAEQGVEQSWHLWWKPLGDGDLVVRVRAEGLAYAGATPGGLHFSDGQGGLGVRYGKAYLVDSVGASTALETEWESGEIAIRVPAALLETAVYPAAIDPVVSTETGVDTPLSYDWTPATPAAVAAGTQWMVTWADQKRGGVWAAQVASNGTVAAPFQVMPGNDVYTNPEVSFGNGVFVFAAVNTTTGDVRVRRTQQNATTFLDGSPVSIAAASGGVGVGYDPTNTRFLLAWGNPSGEVRSTRISPTGSLTVEGSGAGTLLGTGSNPRVAQGALNQRFLVAWTTISNGVQARRVNANSGSVQTLSFPGSFASRVDLASNGTSNSATWLVVGATGSGQVWARPVSYGGTVGSEVTVTQGAAAKSAPAVAALGASAWVVAWLEGRQARFGRLNVALANQSGDGVVLGDLSSSDQGGLPRIGLGGAVSANVFTAWANGASVLASRVSSGAFDVPALTVSSPPPQPTQLVPAIASNGTDYLAVWQDSRTTATEIYAARISQAGGAATAVALSSGPAVEASPAVAYGDGTYMVSWLEGTAVRARTVSPTGTPGTPFSIATTATTKAGPRLANGGGTSWLAVWSESTDVRGQRFSTAGATQGGSIAVSAATGAQSSPDLAGTGAGWLAVWQDSRSGGPEIYGARVDGTGTVNASDANGLRLGAGSAPAVACGGTTCLAAWADTTVPSRVGARRVSGGALDATTLTLGAGGAPTVAFDGRDFAVAFESGGALWTNQVSGAGAVMHADRVPLLTAAGTAVSGAAPRLAAGADGRAALAFTRLDATLGVTRVLASTLVFRDLVTVDVSGNGAVASSPAGLSCTAPADTGSTCSGPFDTVTLTATPSAGWQLQGWTGCTSASGATCTVEAGGKAVTVGVAFTRITYAVTVRKTGSGTGTVTASPTSLACDGLCTTVTATLGQGSRVTLTPNALPGSVFTGWDGAGCTGTASCAFDVTGAVTATATFDLQTFPLRVATAQPALGSVSSDATGTSCGAGCTDVLSDTTVALTATPTPGSRFVSWAGDCSDQPATCTFLMDRARSATASFEVIPIVTNTLTVATAGSGSVTSSDGGISCGATCSKAYPESQSVTLTAAPATGWNFTGWGGDCSGPATTCTLAMSVARNAAATFTLAPVPRTLTVTVNGAAYGSVTSPSGITCGADCTETFGQATSVTLTAVTAPAAGGGTNSFAGWSGACAAAGLTPTCTLPMDADAAVTASFVYTPPSDQTLTVNNPGGGTVTSAPAGVACGATCAGSFPYGTAVTLTATPAGGAFAGWGGACTGPAACTVTMTQARTVSAAFTLPLFFTKSGEGTVTSAPAGLSCGASCSGTSTSFPYGATVTLTAAPAAGQIFAGWSGGACSGSALDCAVPMTQVRNVTATFVVPPPQRYALAVTRSGQGTVTSAPAGIDCGTTCGASYDANTVVTLSANPAVGSVFKGWTGACSGQGTSCQVTMTADRAVTATFEVAQGVALTVVNGAPALGIVSGQGAGIDCGPTCNTTLPAGTAVTLSAVARAGATFDGWSVPACGGAGVCTFVLTAPTTVTARFVTPGAGPSYPLAARSGGPGKGSVSASWTGLVNPIPFDCPTDAGLCVVDVPLGGQTPRATLTPTALGGSRFAGWSGDCTGPGPCVVTLSQSRLVKAVFVPANVQVSATLAGEGTGTVSAGSAALTCDRTWCVANVPSDAADVTLTAAAGPNSTFLGWTGEGCSGTGTCTVKPDRSRAVVASFGLARYPLGVFPLGAGGGTVTSVPAGISCTAGGAGACSMDVAPGTSVTLTAAADGESVFTGWNVPGCAGNACTVWVDGPTVVLATFEPKTVDLVLQLLGRGAGMVSARDLATGTDLSACTMSGAAVTCPLLVPPGTQVGLHAAADPGYQFLGWGGVCPNTAGDCAVTALGAGTIQALFEPNMFRLSVQVLGKGAVSGGAISCATGGVGTCTADISYTLFPLPTVTLAATPEGAGTFEGWSGACAGKGTCTVTMDGARTAIANFSP
ncbi:MAG: hypothetical protein U0229_14160 [Anaeromyxobacter sp.]